MNRLMTAIIALLLCAIAFGSGVIYTATHSKVWTENDSVYIECFGQVWEHGREK